MLPLVFQSGIRRRELSLRGSSTQQNEAAKRTLSDNDVQIAWNTYCETIYIPHGYKKHAFPREANKKFTIFEKTLVKEKTINFRNRISVIYFKAFLESERRN